MRHIMTHIPKVQELEKEILDLIYARGPISRVELSKITNITPATISKVTGELLNQDVIKILGEEHQATAGRRKVLLGIANNHTFYLGSELNVNFVTLCLINNLGETIKKEQYDTPLNNEKKFNVLQYLDLIHDFLKQVLPLRPQALGIAIPGHFSENHCIVSNRYIWRNVSLQPIIDSLQIPIAVENNVHAMAIAHRLTPQRQETDNFVFFHIAHGIFFSHIKNGKIYGQNNFEVGEIGHFIVNPEGNTCICGRRGCLQTYASEDAILKKAVILYDTSPSTFLRQLATSRYQISLETVLKAFEMGDEGVVKIFNNVMKYLAITLNNLSLVLDASKIILHSKLFSDPKCIELLTNSLTRTRFNLINTLPLNLKVDNYTDYDGALAGCYIALQKDLLEY